MITARIAGASPTLEIQTWIDIHESRVYLLVMHELIVVAECEYDLCCDMIQLARLKVNKACRRRGIGKAIIEHIQGRGLSIDARLSERDLVGQLFLSACGFCVVSILDGGSGDDDYLFRWEPEGTFNV